ncbi:hypothetical protein HF275_20960 [Rhizobium leguminosarum]|nr:hypothetical protein [Rhizobium leguminosarum]
MTPNNARLTTSRVGDDPASTKECDTSGRLDDLRMGGVGVRFGHRVHVLDPSEEKGARPYAGDRLREKSVMMAFRLFHSKRKVVDFDACHELQHRVELMRLGRSDIADQSVMIGRRREQRQPLNKAIAEIEGH